MPFSQIIPPSPSPSESKLLGKLLKRILPINFNIEEDTCAKKKAVAEFVSFLWLPYTAPQTNGLNNRKFLSHLLEASGLRSRDIVGLVPFESFEKESVPCLSPWLVDDYLLCVSLHCLSSLHFYI